MTDEGIIELATDQHEGPGTGLKGLLGRITKSRGASESPQVPAAGTKERERYDALMQAVSQSFVRLGADYCFRDGTTVAFTDGGQQIKTKLTDARVIDGMLTLAEAKGWESINLRGSRQFKQAAWLEASLRGFDVRGYEPSRADIERLAALGGPAGKDAPGAQPKEQANAIEQAPARGADGSGAVAPKAARQPPEATRVPTSPGDPAAVAAARALIAEKLGENAKVYVAEVDSGRYTGGVLGTTDAHLVQQLSPRSAVLHPKAALPADAIPAAGTKVAIAYSRGKGQVTEQKQRGNGHEKGITR